MNILRGSRIILRNSHSHSSTFHKYSNIMSNNNTNILLSQLLQETQKQNRILEEINDSVKNNNEVLSYVLVYFMEDQQ